MGRASIETVRTALSDALIATDFDGTLAPIVDDPASARPVDGAAEVLDAMSRRAREVAVISGRPLSFLRPHVPGSVTLVGLYGLETLRGGRLIDDPDSERWRGLVAMAATEALALVPEGVQVEDKGLSLTLHYRRRPGTGPETERLAAQLGERTGLSVRPAKMSVELHPDVHTDKGTVLRGLADGHAGPVVFLGDDVGDLAAFRQLDELAEQGRVTLAVAVQGAETSSEVTDAADMLVDGPVGALELLRQLLR